MAIFQIFRAKRRLANKTKNIESISQKIASASPVQKEILIQVRERFFVEKEIAEKNLADVKLDKEQRKIINETYNASLFSSDEEKKKKQEEKKETMEIYNRAKNLRKSALKNMGLATKQYVKLNIEIITGNSKVWEPIQGKVVGIGWVDAAENKRIIKQLNRKVEDSRVDHEILQTLMKEAKFVPVEKAREFNQAITAFEEAKKIRDDITASLENAEENLSSAQIRFNFVQRAKVFFGGEAKETSVTIEGHKAKVAAFEIYRDAANTLMQHAKRTPEGMHALKQNMETLKAVIAMTEILRVEALAANKAEENRKNRLEKLKEGLQEPPTADEQTTLARRKLKSEQATRNQASAKINVEISQQLIKEFIQDTKANPNAINVLKQKMDTFNEIKKLQDIIRIRLEKAEREEIKFERTRMEALGELKPREKSVARKNYDASNAQHQLQDDAIMQKMMADLKANSPITQEALNTVKNAVETLERARKVRDDLLKQIKKMDEPYTKYVGSLGDQGPAFEAKVGGIIKDDADALQSQHLTARLQFETSRSQKMANQFNQKEMRVFIANRRANIAREDLGIMNAMINEAGENYKDLEKIKKLEGAIHAFNELRKLRDEILKTLDKADKELVRKEKTSSIAKFIFGKKPKSWMEQENDQYFAADLRGDLEFTRKMMINLKPPVSVEEIRKITAQIKEMNALRKKRDAIRKEMMAVLNEIPSGVKNAQDMHAVLSLMIGKAQNDPSKMAEVKREIDLYVKIIKKLNPVMKTMAKFENIAGQIHGMEGISPEFTSYVANKRADAKSDYDLISNMIKSVDPKDENSLKTLNDAIVAYKLVAKLRDEVTNKMYRSLGRHPVQSYNAKYQDNKNQDLKDDYQIIKSLMANMEPPFTKEKFEKLKEAIEELKEMQEHRDNLRKLIKNTEKDIIKNEQKLKQSEEKLRKAQEKLKEHNSKEPSKDDKLAHAMWALQKARLEGKVNGLQSEVDKRTIKIKQLKDNLKDDEADYAAIRSMIRGSTTVESIKAVKAQVQQYFRDANDRNGPRDQLHQRELDQVSDRSIERQLDNNLHRAALGLEVKQQKLATDQAELKKMQEELAKLGKDSKEYNELHANIEKLESKIRVQETDIVKMEARYRNMENNAAVKKAEIRKKDNEFFIGQLQQKYQDSASKIKAAQPVQVAQAAQPVQPVQVAQVAQVAQAAPPAPVVTPVVAPVAAPTLAAAPMVSAAHVVAAPAVATAVPTAAPLATSAEQEPEPKPPLATQTVAPAPKPVPASRAPSPALPTSPTSSRVQDEVQDEQDKLQKSKSKTIEDIRRIQKMWEAIVNMSMNDPRWDRTGDREKAEIQVSACKEAIRTLKYNGRKVRREIEEGKNPFVDIEFPPAYYRDLYEKVLYEKPKPVEKPIQPVVTAAISPPTPKRTVDEELRLGQPGPNATPAERLTSLQGNLGALKQEGGTATPSRKAANTNAPKLWTPGFTRQQKLANAGPIPVPPLKPAPPLEPVVAPEDEEARRRRASLSPRGG